MDRGKNITEIDVVSLIKMKFKETGGSVKIKMLKGDKSFLAKLHEDGVEVSNLRQYPFLPWIVFIETINLLIKKGGEAIRGDAMNYKLGDEGLPLDSVEGHIAYTVYNKKIGDSVFRRVTPITCIFIWAGVCEADRGKLLLCNYESKIKNCVPNFLTEDIITESVKIDESNRKNEFIEKYCYDIIEWTKKNANEIDSARLNYKWGNKDTIECVKERNDVSTAIIISRIKNGGGVDLETLDKIVRWGFNRGFPLRDPEQALVITKQAFEKLEEGNIVGAAQTLMSVKGVGISRASKIIGLFNQDELCIYDSRVGNALKDLKHENEKIVLCPPGYSVDNYDLASNKVWAENYERLIWTVEIMRDNLNSNGHYFRIADIEMALFMMGK